MLIIRRLDEDHDLDDLISLSREFFAEYEGHHPVFFRIGELHDRDVIDYFRRTTDVEDGATFVAVEDGRITGYITVLIRSQPGYWRIKQVGAISGLMVRQDRRRQGIGRRLMAVARTYFQGKGVMYFTVYTATANEAAIQLYRQSGMELLYVTLLGKVAGDSNTSVAG